MHGVFSVVIVFVSAFFKGSVAMLALYLHFACADSWQITFWQQISGTADRTMKPVQAPAWWPL